MKSWLSHILVVVVAIILTSILMKQCSGVTTVTETVTTIDTLYQEVVVTEIDTIVEVRWKTRYDTLVKEVEVPTYTNTDSFEVNALYSYSEIYDDSTYQVAGNIFYDGRIHRHDQMLIKMKDEITFIPKVTTVYKNRDVIKTVRSTRQPRFLIGAYVTADKFSVEQIGINATMVDNKYRQYTVGKDILSDYGWMAQAKVPIFYSNGNK